MTLEHTRQLLARCLAKPAITPPHELPPTLLTPALPPAPIPPHETYTEGACVDCGAEQEADGRPVVAVDLGDPLCRDCRSCRRPGGY